MKTIFVVEDDTDTRDTLVELLSEQGYVVSGVSDGAEALRHLLESRPDVMLIDLVLPTMDGWALIEAMRHAPALEAIPVIATSALFPSPPLPAGIQLLRKPFELDHLFRALDV